MLTMKMKTTMTAEMEMETEMTLSHVDNNVTATIQQGNDIED